MIYDSRRRLGQHFLVSRAVLADIIAAANIQPDDSILEIGPGTGILTRALAKRAGRVIAVEKDVQLFMVLREQLKMEGIANARLIRGDILRIPLQEVVVHFLRSWEMYNKAPDRVSGEATRAAGDSGYKVVANIPYYLTSRLIRKLLTEEPRPYEILLSVQREVAERMIAKPPQMNRLALAVQAYGTPEIVARIPASAFSPRPKVDSALIRISNISTEFFDATHTIPERFFAMIRQAFSQRRKTLTNSLAPLFGGKTAARAALKTIGRAETARPQELSLEDWARMASRL